MTLSPFRDLSFALFLPPLSLSRSLFFPLGGIFEFRRFRVTDARLSPGGKVEKGRARVERGQYLYWTRERAGESSRGISLGNLPGPDVAKTQETDVPRCRRLARLALVSRPRRDANGRHEEGDERKNEVARLGGRRWGGGGGGGCRRR